MIKLKKKDLYKTNEAFASYNEYFNAVREASLAAHRLATNTTNAKLPIPNKTANKKLAADKSEEKIEFEINDEMVKFYEESYKFKKEKK